VPSAFEGFDLIAVLWESKANISSNPPYGHYIFVVQK